MASFLLITSRHQLRSPFPLNPNSAQKLQIRKNYLFSALP